jgi:hypothetical protein
MAHVAIDIEGGLVSGDLLERIAATPEAVEGQRPGDFGVEGRLSEEIQSAFSDAATYWNAFQARLHRGRESATTITRETWMLPLLEQFGYDLRFQRAALQAGGNAYPISHRRGGDENASPVHIVASDQELDKRGEAKQSPHAMVQDYLNRTDALWGIVTNGKRLRLLRDTARFSKPSYIEFDLEAMMAGGLYSDFVLLYRLVHASRLPRGVGDAHECLLERYHQQGIEEGGRVRERLRDGVREALEILGTGLLAHPDSTAFQEKFTATRIDNLGYYRQLLRLIYRLLFLMVAEERRLLFVPSREEAARQEIYTRWYSIARLRERADARLFDDGESDLWEGLKQTFRLFEEANTASELGLTALDGELFGRFACADLIDAKDIPGPRLRNDKLLSAIWHLSTFEDSDGKKKQGPRRRVNFAGLDVEELGSVYEALLDYHPRVTIEGERSRFELVAGSERKSTGSYYTPPELVRELIKSALEPVVADRLAKAGNKEEKERAVLSLKVCDPASGSGHFLLAAARRIGRELAKIRSGEAEPNPEDYRRAVRDVIRRCIYAVDKNPLAVDLCKVALWIEGHASGLPLSFLDNHVKNGDSLVGVLDLDVLEAGVPDGAYAAVTGDDKKAASAIKKENKAEAKEASLFRRNVKGDIDRISSSFGAIADLPETTPDEVHAKEISYVDLRRGADWQKAKSACDLWTAAFFAPLTGDDKGAVPTTRNIWDAIAGHLPQGRVAGRSLALADEQCFFHWPLEFPDVFAQGGFDVILGNPPWEVSEFRADDLAEPSASENHVEDEVEARGGVIAAAKMASSKKNQFFKSSGRYTLSRGGKTNLYVTFLEFANAARNATGAVGFVVPLGFITDETTAQLFASVVDRNQLHSLKGFENEEKIFPGIHNQTKFCLFTSARPSEMGATFLMFARRIEHLNQAARWYTLTSSEIEIFNPDTHTAPLFRTNDDKILAEQLYRRWPVVGRWIESARPRFKRGFYNTSTDKKKLRQFKCENGFAAGRPGAFTALYEGKMFGAFDHRFGTYEGQSNAQARKGVLPHVTDEQHRCSEYLVTPRYVVAAEAMIEKYVQLDWERPWVIGWRDVTNSTSERTSVAAALPRVVFDDGVSLFLLDGPSRYSAYALALLNSLVFDYLIRQKYAGSHLKAYMVAQVPAPSPVDLGESEISFITERVLELVFTTSELAGFAADLGYKSTLFAWDGGRRALLRAELDAYYAYLYGLTRRELQYILDPKAVMSEECPSETFRVLKENEFKEFGEYRTQRLVLDAWDRFVTDGTFDVSRLRDPQYIDRVAAELSKTRVRLEEAEANQRALLMFAAETPKPTLFVEGITDVPIIEAAWSVFFPSEPIPVKVHAAGGTKEMGSLAGPGKALREVLGDRLVLALADNDAAGRRLIDDGHVKKGGLFKQLPNGIHWCLLKPTESFAAAMKAHDVPLAYWPFTIEASFPPSLRRVAEAAGAWAFSDTPQAELMDNPDLARRLFALLPTLGSADDAYWYLMAPAPESKEAFSRWVTQAAQLTEANYAAFEEIMRGLRDLLARRSGSEKRDSPRAA